MKKALVIYLSITGNTEKIANSVHEGLVAGGFDSRLLKLKDASDEDFFDYDLVCFGSPSYNWHVPKPAEDYLKAKFDRYRKEGRILPGAPVIPGKHYLVFCSYSGPHTGIREAIPAGKYIGQFFEHFGFALADEWYILSEFVGSPEHSTLGRMGNITGLPGASDLIRLRESAFNLAGRLS